jgi:hypothetical protein
LLYINEGMGLCTAMFLDRKKWLFVRGRARLRRWADPPGASRWLADTHGSSSIPSSQMSTGWKEGGAINAVVGAASIAKGAGIVPQYTVSTLPPSVWPTQVGTRIAICHMGKYTRVTRSSPANKKMIVTGSLAPYTSLGATSMSQEPNCWSACFCTFRSNYFRLIVLHGCTKQ